jgi:PAS domain-containing protein
MQAPDPEAMTLAVGRLHGVSAEEMFRLAVDACPSGMIMTDRSGAIVMLNTEIELLFGYSRDELIGQSIEIRAPRASRRQHVGLRAGFAQNPRTRRIGAGRDLFGLAWSDSSTIFSISKKIESGEVVFDMMRVEVRPLVEHASRATAASPKASV